MALRAFQIEPQMSPMAERNGLPRSHSHCWRRLLLGLDTKHHGRQHKDSSHHGRANATKESPAGLFQRPPPTATTTYCFPLTLYVEGVAYAPVSSTVSQRTLPVRESNARNLWSWVAPMKTNPPAVAMEPPKLVVPVSGIPRAVSSGCSPNGIRHRKSPVFRST